MDLRPTIFFFAIACKVSQVSGFDMTETITYCNNDEEVSTHDYLGFGSLLTLPACSDDDDDYPVERYRPTALVTVCPDNDGTFVMQLDNSTRLVASNLKESPFGDKEVRALVNYTESGMNTETDRIRTVQVNWIDSIRTKLPVETAGEENDRIYGNDPIEIVRRLGHRSRGRIPDPAHPHLMGRNGQPPQHQPPHRHQSRQPLRTGTKA